MTQLTMHHARPDAIVQLISRITSLPQGARLVVSNQLSRNGRRVCWVCGTKQQVFIALDAPIIYHYQPGPITPADRTFLGVSTVKGDAS